MSTLSMFTLFYIFTLSVLLLIFIIIILKEPEYNFIKYFYFNNRRGTINEKMLKNILLEIIKYIHDNNLYYRVISIKFIECNENKNYVLSNHILYLTQSKPIYINEIYNQIEWDKLTFISHENDVLVKLEILY